MVSIQVGPNAHLVDSKVDRYFGQAQVWNPEGRNPRDSLLALMKLLDDLFGDGSLQDRRGEHGRG
jgi:hypothetical protein